MYNNQIAIYGAGGNGQKVYHALLEHGVEVAFFIDLYSPENHYQGCPIYRPDNILDTTVTVLVSVACTSEQIKQELILLGVSECLNMNEIIFRYPYVLERFIPKAHQEALVASTNEDSKNLAWLESILDDDASKRCLKAIIDFRSSPSSQYYVENDWLAQYFPPWLLDLPLWKEGISFVDCGSYIGDTLDSAISILSQTEIKLNTMICFEPDPKNFSCLKEKAKKYKHEGVSTFLYPCGVWKENTILNFSAGESQGKFTDKNTNENTSNLLPVVSLDHVCAGTTVNFIKMDIEGAEPQAIEGAKQLIIEQTPLLAISVYHETSHLWQIAQMIHSYNNNYTFKLHCHGDFGLEIILYAIPKK
ncbi:FkbM family methyltransferase [Marinomonas sp. 2405UD68-3]|uniref:FkbM family methyltransferase n=1 Tax=Marinomonas sp. 2405UD68-3 TaxID=3391835 RepID=UPI0039C9D2E1